MRRTVICAISVLTVLAGCSKEDPTDLGKDIFMMPLVDWTLTAEALAEMQHEDYVLSSDSKEYIYEYSGAEDVIMTYHFNSKGLLDASLVMIETSSTNQKRIDKLLPKFREVGSKDGHTIYINKDRELAAMVMEGVGYNGKDYIAVAFSQYVENEEGADDDLDYVDLGLSVKWAKANVGADAPEKAGGYYSWSETSTKSSYWRENYSYCNNNSNQYIFKYTNPLSTICGTQYDVATEVMGNGWRMPTREEAVELIYSCTWEGAELNGVNGMMATGPNGRKIFFPHVGHKKQDKGVVSGTWLWTGESPSKSDDSAYYIGLYSQPELELEWKAWGLNVRAVCAD